MDAATFFKCLSDTTRLKIMLLTAWEGELCVCEFTSALELSQPKISRHLAQLRHCRLLQDQRRGQWVYYAIHDELPDWCREIIDITGRHTPHLTDDARHRLTRARNTRKPLCG